MSTQTEPKLIKYSSIPKGSDVGGSYLAHVTIRSDEDGEVFTVETEFKAANWVAAWHHVLGLPKKFGGSMVRHKLCAVKPDDGTLTPVAEPHAVHTQSAPLALPRPPVAYTPPKVEEPTLPDWAIRIVVPTPTIVALNV